MIEDCRFLIFEVSVANCRRLIERQMAADNSIFLTQYSKFIYHSAIAALTAEVKPLSWFEGQTRYLNFSSSGAFSVINA